MTDPLHPQPASPLRVVASLVPLLALACTDYGYHEYEQVDVFEQRAAEMVDVLLVVDDSASMSYFQELLGDNLPSFLVWLLEADIDYKIGVITTDVFVDSAGVIGEDIVTPQTEDADSLFGDMTNVGVVGSGAEMGLEAAHIALLDPEVAAENDHFLREQALLSLVFLTDEEDCSPLTTSQYLQAFRSVKADDRDATNANAMVVFDSESCGESVENQTREGTRYVDVAEQSGGASVDLCSEDFAGIVEDVSLAISRLKDVFYLTGLPDPRSLEVEIDDVEVGCDEGVWSYEVGELQGVETGTIVFSEETMPGVGSKLAVRYNFGTGDAALFCTDEAR